VFDTYIVQTSKKTTI